MPTEWINHDGQAVFVGRFTGLDEDAYIAEIERCRDEILKQPEGSVLFLTRCDTKTTSRVSDRWRLFREECAAHLKASSVVGLNAFARAIASMINRELKFAATEEDGLEWLVKQ